jgi:hypothetical protein
MNAYPIHGRTVNIVGAPGHDATARFDNLDLVKVPVKPSSLLLIKT